MTGVNCGVIGRLVYQLRSSDLITDALVCLHWLQIPERIEYKITLLTYKVTNNMALRYLGPFVRVADLSGRRALRSAVTNHLTVPAAKLPTIGSQAFSFLVLKHGTNYWKKSPLQHLCLPSNVTSRRSYLENHYRTLLLTDTSVDLMIILNYFGHSKEFCLIDNALGGIWWWFAEFHQIGVFSRIVTVLFQVCSTLVHVTGLATVDDIAHLGSLLTEKSAILSLHLTKYVSSVAEEAEKGSRNVRFFLHCIFV